ncbi:hypothetical protein [Almyronema epifaneia]|uniref:Uncharacterized protein n=1 Tax=Almyronema epifaneia S1 TaxID=2991925 RepID=A0ABW6IG42_9CYAN
MKLTTAELAHIQTQLQAYAPAQRGVNRLIEHQGQLEAALDDLLVETYGAPAEFGKPSLWQVTRDVLRQELCSDEGFRGRIRAYVEKPQQATFLTGAIIYLVEQVALPFTLSPSLAALIVLYVSKVGLDIFCRYTEPAPPEA